MEKPPIYKLEPKEAPLSRVLQSKMGSETTPAHQAGAWLSRRFKEFRSYLARNVRPALRYSRALAESTKRKIHDERWTQTLPPLGFGRIQEVETVAEQWLWWAEGGDADPQLLHTIEALLQAATSWEQVETQLSAAADQESWDAFVDKAYERGAGLAHKWTKTPVPRPNQVAQNGEDYGRTSLPPALLADESKKWGKLWTQKAGLNQDFPWPEEALLPPLQVTEIRRAARSFRPGTSAFEGISPRQIAALSDPALEALSSLFRTWEQAGDVAPGQQDMITALLPKASRRIQANRTIQGDI